MMKIERGSYKKIRNVGDLGFQSSVKEDVSAHQTTVSITVAAVMDACKNSKFKDKISVN